MRRLLYGILTSRRLRSAPIGPLAETVGCESVIVSSYISNGIRDVPTCEILPAVVAESVFVLDGCVAVHAADDLCGFARRLG